ncbi:unnamed protein product [Amoebophrya sp. A25]|nr:unnamed protein product [Amoebophrya sp. A25]|eukprot:GSA25T00001528001.1
MASSSSSGTWRGPQKSHTPPSRTSAPSQLSIIPSRDKSTDDKLRVMSDTYCKSSVLEELTFHDSSEHFFYPEADAGVDNSTSEKEDVGGITFGSVGGDSCVSSMGAKTGQSASWREVVEVGGGSGGQGGGNSGALVYQGHHLGRIPTTTSINNHDRKDNDVGASPSEKQDQNAGGGSLSAKDVASPANLHFLRSAFRMSRSFSFSTGRGSPFFWREHLVLGVAAVFVGGLFHLTPFFVLLFYLQRDLEKKYRADVGEFDGAVVSSDDADEDYNYQGSCSAGSGAGAGAAAAAGADHMNYNNDQSLVKTSPLHNLVQNHRPTIVNAYTVVTDERMNAVSSSSTRAENYRVSSPSGARNVTSTTTKTLKFAEIGETTDVEVDLDLQDPLKHHQQRYQAASPQYPQASPQYPQASPQYPQASPQYPQASPQQSSLSLRPTSPDFLSATSSKLSASQVVLQQHGGAVGLPLSIKQPLGVGPRAALGGGSMSFMRGVSGDFSDASYNPDSPVLRRKRRVLLRTWNALLCMSVLHGLAIFAYAVLVMMGSQRTASEAAFPLVVRSLNGGHFAGEKGMTLGSGTHASTIVEAANGQTPLSVEYGFFDERWWAPEAQSSFGFDKRGGNLYFPCAGSAGNSGENCCLASSFSAASSPVRVEPCASGNQDQLWGFIDGAKAFFRLDFSGVNGGVISDGAYLALAADGAGSSPRLLLADTGNTQRIGVVGAEISSSTDPAAIGFGLYLLCSASAALAFAWRLLAQKNTLRGWFRERGAGSPLRSRRTWRQDRILKKVTTPAWRGGIGFGFKQHQQIRGGGGFSKI